jgi:predicted amidohydrolase YtcJ
MQARKKSGKGWIVGFGWLDAKIGGFDLAKNDLDEISSDRPILLIQATFHQSVANSRALELMGITRSTRDPRCGTILRESDGMPTGVLVESAQVPTFKLVMETDTEKLADLIEARAKELLKFGITAIHDPGVTPAAEAAYNKLHDEERLPVSVLMMPHGEAVLDNQLSYRLHGPVTGVGDERLRVGPVKLFADGATAETVAFSLIIGGQTINSGSYRDDFEEILFAATEKGFRVCVHSFGNATTDAVLTAFENAVIRAPVGFEMRPRLEHVTLITTSQIKRLVAMGGCACIQPQFLSRAQNTKQVVLDDGKWYAYGDLVKGGVTVASSSDNPGGFMDACDPIQGSVMGSTMSDGADNITFPDQVLPFEQWLWMYTAGGAYAGGQEKERGMLKKGMVADLVVLEGNLDPKNPPVVVETWVAGKQVYGHRV